MREFQGILRDPHSILVTLDHWMSRSFGFRHLSEAWVSDPIWDRTRELEDWEPLMEHINT